MSHEQIPDVKKQSSRLQTILDRYQDKRIVVVGTTCTGKSTFLNHIKNSLDMDNLIFPLLSHKYSVACRRVTAIATRNNHAATTRDTP